MFKTIADVRTADTLNLKVPDCELHIVDVEPTELQTELVENYQTELMRSTTVPLIRHR